jgi:hypothetical protein
MVSGNYPAKSAKRLNRGRWAHPKYTYHVNTIEGQLKLLRINTLKKGWHDRDELLLHAAFQVLIDFVECEKPENTINWNYDKIYKHTWKEIIFLYKWWKEIRPLRQNPLDEMKLVKPPIKLTKIPGSVFYQLVELDDKKYIPYNRALKKYYQLEQKWYEEDQQYLHRLIEIRSFLWT